jgi:hypothetical protein
MVGSKKNVGITILRHITLCVCYSVCVGCVCVCVCVYVCVFCEFW